MTWKDILPLAFILTLIIILLLISNSIFKSCNQSSNHSIIHSIDTVFSQPDTVFQSDTVFIPKLKAVLDTVYMADSTSVPVASADTTFQKDSSRISVKYFFPPLNFFDIQLDIRERTISKVKTITEYKEVSRPEPFYRDEWFWSSAVLIILLLSSILGAN